MEDKMNKKTTCLTVVTSFSLGLALFAAPVTAFADVLEDETSTNISQTNTAPSAPTNVTFYEQNSYPVWLKWTASVDDTDYNLKYYIYRDGMPLSKVDSFANAQEGVDFSAEPGMTYAYTVASKDSSGNISPMSNSVTVTIPKADTSPTSPVLTSINVNSDFILFSLEATDDNDVPSYDIYVNGSLYERGYSGTEYTLYLTPGETFEISAIARDSKNNTSSASNSLYATGDFGTIVTPAPGPLASSPLTDFRTEYVGHNVTYFSWSSGNIPAYDLGAYDIYRNGAKIDTVWGNGSDRSSYADKTAEANTTYTYNVVAHDWRNTNYDLSESYAISTPADPNGLDTLAPSNIALNYYYYNSYMGLQMTWTPAVDNFGSVEYQIYRDGVLIQTQTDTTYFNDQNVTPGSTYNYTVVTVDSSGNTGTPLEIPNVQID
jgi:fibronectin type 3 domain-containing protein